MKNGLDEQYIDLLKDILENGVEKNTRNGKVLSVFGRSIRYKFKDGKFPLLTTKKMPFRLIATELLWFLRGDTNIKYLVDNDCHIWDGDTYKNYLSKIQTYTDSLSVPDDISEFQGVMDSLNKQIKSGVLTQEEFINKIKTDDEFANKWGDLGPVYGKQWRSWTRRTTREEKILNPGVYTEQIDQIQNLINELKTNPDSRRLMVSAWNVGELDQMVLPPCHCGFQVYTRELGLKERCKIQIDRLDGMYSSEKDIFIKSSIDEVKLETMDKNNIPKRAISLSWQQRSVDTFLGLPFNIASYGLLLEIIAKAVNMVPDELIGNLGDTHIYLNHIEQVKEQIGRELTFEEKIQWVMSNTDVELENVHITEAAAALEKRTRQPFPLPTLNINTEFWSTESSECGIGSIDASAVFNGFHDDSFCKCLLEEDIQLSNYQSHPTIKAPLSN